jgi:hypothetical protein
MQPQKNSGNRGSKKESGVSTKNRRFVQNLIDDLRKNEDVSEISIARVLGKLGNGRVEVFYVKNDDKGIPRSHIEQAVIRGSFRGKGKRSVWFDIGSIVAIANVGLSGSACNEIMAVIPPEQIRDMRKEFNIDPRILAIYIIDEKVLMSDIPIGEGGFEFEGGDDEKEEEIDIDTI